MRPKTVHRWLLLCLMIVLPRMFHTGLTGLRSIVMAVFGMFVVGENPLIVRQHENSQCPVGKIWSSHVVQRKGWLCGKMISSNNVELTMCHSFFEEICSVLWMGHIETAVIWKQYKSPLGNILIDLALDPGKSLFKIIHAECNTDVKMMSMQNSFLKPLIYCRGRDFQRTCTCLSQLWDTLKVVFVFGWAKNKNNPTLWLLQVWKKSKVTFNMNICHFYL